MSPKGPPFEFFCYFATECVFINQKGSPFYIFRHCATFSERIFFFENFKFFSKKNVLRFLSLRYSADLRRSRLVHFHFELSFQTVKQIKSTQNQPTILRYTLYYCIKNIEYCNGTLWYSKINQFWNFDMFRNFVKNSFKSDVVA